MSEAIQRPPHVSQQVGKDPYSVPLEKIDVADFELFEADEIWGWFERLREEDPVHYCVSQDEEVGGYWSVTKFNDIVEVEKNPEVYSSEPSIVIVDPDPEFRCRPDSSAWTASATTVTARSFSPSRRRATSAGSSR